jgi:two-component system LytT family sensor kinase
MLLEQYLVILFLKLAVAASLASILARFAPFQRILMAEERTMEQRLALAASFGLLYGVGVAARLISKGTYQALDLGMEGSLVAGILGGYVCGLCSGILIAMPALFSGELLTMPLLAGLGVAGGLLRDLAPEKEDIWRFSPFPDLSLWRLVRGWRNWRRTTFHLALFLTIVFAEFLRVSLAQSFDSRYLYHVFPENPQQHPMLVVFLFATTVFAVALPLKVWNNTRTERMLEAQRALLTEARLKALTSQINPHFLFNTLNSVSTLIRINPDQARTMVYKLSSILRKLLKKQESLTPLREELAFIDDYLAIELVRFGDKLKFDKEVAADSLNLLVPSMILQPLVENSIKHGLSRKVEGGQIRIHASARRGMLTLVVEDDGEGIAGERLENLFDLGIGVSNVNERLKVLYGHDFRFSVISRPGGGTRTEIEIPQTTAPPQAAPPQQMA